MCRENWKLLPLPGIVLSAMLLLLLPFVVSFQYLDFQPIATIGETVAPILGILLLTPLAFCEGPIGRHETLACRPVPYWRGFAIRLCIMILTTVLSIGLFIVLAAWQSNLFDVLTMGIGLATTALFYGSMALTIGHVTHSQSASYLVAFAFFVLEFYTRGKYTGRYYTLSLMSGTLWEEKYLLFSIAAMLLVINIFLCKRQLSLHTV